MPEKNFLGVWKGSGPVRNGTAEDLRVGFLVAPVIENDGNF